MYNSYISLVIFKIISVWYENNSYPTTNVLHGEFFLPTEQHAITPSTCNYRHSFCRNACFHTTITVVITLFNFVYNFAKQTKYRQHYLGPICCNFMRTGILITTVWWCDYGSSLTAEHQVYMKSGLLQFPFSFQYTNYNNPTNSPREIYLCTTTPDAKTIIFKICENSCEGQGQMWPKCEHFLYLLLCT